MLKLFSQEDIQAFTQISMKVTIFDTCMTHQQDFDDFHRYCSKIYCLLFYGKKMAKNLRNPIKKTRKYYLRNTFHDI